MRVNRRLVCIPNVGDELEVGPGGWSFVLQRSGETNREFLVRYSDETRRRVLQAIGTGGLRVNIPEGARMRVKRVFIRRGNPRPTMVLRIVGGSAGGLSGEFDVLIAEANRAPLIHSGWRTDTVEATIAELIEKKMYYMLLCEDSEGHLTISYRTPWKTLSVLSGYTRLEMAKARTPAQVSRYKTLRGFISALCGNETPREFIGLVEQRIADGSVNSLDADRTTVVDPSGKKTRLLEFLRGVD